MTTITKILNSYDFTTEEKIELCSKLAGTCRSKNLVGIARCQRLCENILIALESPQTISDIQMARMSYLSNQKIKAYVKKLIEIGAVERKVYYAEETITIWTPIKGEKKEIHPKKIVFSRTF